MRATLLLWHRRVALGMAVLLLSQFLTGCVLVFREELMAFGLPPASGNPTTAVPLSVLESRIRMLHPTEKLLAVQYPSSATRAYLFRLASPDGRMTLLSVDPLEPQPRPLGAGAYMIEWLRGFHEDLQLGLPGRCVVGLEALVLAFLVGTGWTLWWPGLSRLAGSLRMPWRGALRLKLFFWHRSLGCILGLLLVPTIITGVILSLGAFLPSWVPNVVPPRFDAVSDDARISVAHALFPSLQIREARFDPDSGGLRRIVLRRPGAGLRAPITDISFDPARGRVTAIVDPSRLAGYDWLASWGFPVHSAQWGSLKLRLLLLATGLGAVTLASLGIALWVLRRPGKGSK